MSKDAKKLDSQLTEAIVGTLREPIIILDKNLRVIMASRAFYDTFKLEHKQVQGKVFYEVGNSEWNIPALRILLQEVIPKKTNVEGYEVNHDFVRLGKRTMIINAREIEFGDNKKNIFLSISDVTDERDTKLEKDKLMHQKDTLLKEMRHRIANSLQLIASIILLKAGTVKSEESRIHLEDAHDRILSIATVQRNLDPTSDESLVHVVDYLKTLCASLTRSMIGGRKPITIEVIGGDGTATRDQAIGLGLMTTELVMNSLKHAFPKGEGSIIVSYKSEGYNWQLNIKDDGIGITASNRYDREGLGTNIIDSLALQLNAEIKRVSDPGGTDVSISHSK